MKANLLLVPALAACGLSFCVGCGSAEDVGVGASAEQAAKASGSGAAHGGSSGSSGSSSGGSSGSSSSGSSGGGSSCSDTPVAHVQTDPNGWFVMGNAPESYVIDVDPSLTFNGRPNAHLRSKSASASASEFGTLGTHIDPKAYAGKKLRFSAVVKGTNITGWGGLWMRVDGPDGSVLAFDNMYDRAITGDTDWNRYQVVLDVDPKAVDIYFGVLLDGAGEIWAGDDALEVVDGGAYEIDANAWLVAGSAPQDYSIGADTKTARCSRPSGHIGASCSASPRGFGALMQTISADDYRGHRVRMAAYVKAAQLEHAGLWMRVDAANGDVLSFDNMNKRPITGTSDWTGYDVVLDVPKNAASIFFGMLSDGKGDAWVDGLWFDKVGKDVPTTD